VCIYKAQVNLELVNNGKTTSGMILHVNQFISQKYRQVITKIIKSPFRTNRINMCSNINTSGSTDKIKYMVKRKTIAVSAQTINKITIMNEVGINSSFIKIR